MSERPTVDPRTLTALLFEWLIIVAAIALALRAATWWSYAIALVVIATRQHALLMLYHDAVHGLLARNMYLNDLLINLFVGVPHLLPVDVYRPLHLKHHRMLGTHDDPERRYLYAGQPWQYRSLSTGPLLRQLAGDMLMINGLRTMVAWLADGGRPPMRRTTAVVAAVWTGGFAVFALASPHLAVIVLALWFAPLLTLTNLLQKLRSFGEHSGGPGVTPGWDDWTYSWRIGLLGRLTIWPYHINLHREHHASPAVPWHGLPTQVDETAPALRGSMLQALLHRRAK